MTRRNQWRFFGQKKITVNAVGVLVVQCCFCASAQDRETILAKAKGEKLSFTTAPHPNVGKLFIDFSASEEGQRFVEVSAEARPAKVSSPMTCKRKV
jgi:hypothetical protein